MVIKNGIELECFIQSETSNVLSDLRIGFELESCDVQIVTFYSIDMISPYPDPYNPAKVYCELSVGGITFICNCDYQTIKKKIEDDTKV